MSAPIQVLYVDDEHDIRTIAMMSLGLDPGMEVRSAASGTEALALLDVMMPGMDGPALLTEIRARPDIAVLPVIFMTARARQSDIDAYRALGASGVIIKPFDPIELAKQVRALIGQG